MLTQCPNCQTTFRVTSEILRVAEGQVRCGRCQTQFNALERLIDEAAPGSDVESGRFLRAPRFTPQRDESPAIEVDEPDAQEDITLEGRHIEISGTYRVPNQTDAAGEQEVRQEFTEEWVEIDDLEADETNAAGTAAADTDDFEPLSKEIHTADDADASNDVYAEDAAASDVDADDPYAEDAYASRARDVPLSKVEDVIARAAAAAAALRAAGPRDAIFATPPRRYANRGPSLPVEEELDLLNPKSQLAHTSLQEGSLKWKWLAAPLLLMLLVQVIHHYRSDLARHPQIGAALMSFYGSLRLPLTPEWELHSYEIKQWGVLSDPAAPGTLKVRASLTNRAKFAQPYPLLKLMLEDRWGDQVRAREFEPTEYLDPGTPANRLLGPQQQTNATINIVDPGPDAEGFRFDVCLRGRAGPVCAADIP